MKLLVLSLLLTVLVVACLAAPYQEDTGFIEDGLFEMVKRRRHAPVTTCYDEEKSEYCFCYYNVRTGQLLKRDKCTQVG